MATPNFEALLNEAPTEVKSPPPLPVGTYLCTVGQWVAGKSSKKNTPFAEFPLTIVAPLDDVDAEALEEMGGCAGRQLRTTYYITEDAVFLLDQFHEHCGIDLSTPASRGIRNDEVLNAQVLAYVKHRPSDQDPSRVFLDVSRTAPAT